MTDDDYTREVKALLDRVTAALPGDFTVRLAPDPAKGNEGQTWQVGRDGRYATLIFKHVPPLDPAVATLDATEPQDRDGQDFVDARMAVGQIVASESLVAASIYQDVLQPERDGGDSLMQKLKDTA